MIRWLRARWPRRSRVTKTKTLTSYNTVSAHPCSPPLPQPDAPSGHTFWTCPECGDWWRWVGDGWVTP